MVLIHQNIHITLKRKERAMLKKLLSIFHDLVEMVRQDHHNKKALLGSGHSFEHALMVGQYCLQIEEDPLAKQLAWIAALCHNTDRLFPEYDSYVVSIRVSRYLSETNLTSKQRALIIEAVLRHSQRPVLSDNLITVVLMDADKLANLGCQAIIRSGQFRHNLPVIDLRYLSERPPGTSFTAPGSVYWDLLGHLEWGEPGWLRTPKAIELAKPLIKEHRDFLEGLVKQYQDTGLLPYPFPEDFEKK